MQLTFKGIPAKVCPLCNIEKNSRLFNFSDRKRGTRYKICAQCQYDRDKINAKKRADKKPLDKVDTEG